MFYEIDDHGFVINEVDDERDLADYWEDDWSDYDDDRFDSNFGPFDV